MDSTTTTTAPHTPRLFVVELLVTNTQYVGLELNQSQIKFKLVILVTPSAQAHSSPSTALCSALLALYLESLRQPFITHLLPWVAVRHHSLAQ